MMLPTHALAGMVLALPVTLLAPELTVYALLAGFFGGIFPDLDLYNDHRKSLHYPVYYSLFGIVALLTAVVAPTEVTVGLAVFLLAAGIHCLADTVGGGLELRPWEATSNRAVYNHYSDRWIRPRRWIRYDGAPEDFLLSASLGAVLVPLVGARFRLLVGTAVLIAALYTVVRRILPPIASVIVGVIPTHLHPFLPDRYLETRS